MTTGFCWHELFAWHDAGTYGGKFIEPIGTADSPETKRRFRNLLDASGLLAKLAPIEAREATDAEILRVHAPEHLARVAAADEKGGDVGRRAYIGPGGLAIVRLAAGAAIESVDAVLSGRVANAYALVRPCGHHATRDESLGFCILNNIAIATAHALATRGLSRVAIVDWDVHHGNGAQSIFWTDPRVLTISLHQDMLFHRPGGFVEENGEGPGKGTNLNVPLPPGCGTGAYMAALERVAQPALARFRPELIIVASGLDANWQDPQGRMNLHSESYRAMTGLVMDSAARLCGGKLAMVHEGGYSPHVVPFAGLRIVETLSGIRTSVEDPFLPTAQRQPAQALQPHEAAVIARAAENVARVPEPAGKG